MTEQELQEEPVEEVQEVQEQQPPQWSQQDEDEARAFGWKPADEWKGDLPPGYLDTPSAYMERVQGSRPFQEMKRRLDAVTEQSADQIARIEAASRGLVEHQRREFDRRLEDIQRQKREAVDSADTKTYEALERQEADLRKDAPQEAPPQAQAAPEVDAYAKTPEGAWLGNPALLAEARVLIDNSPVALSMGVGPQLSWARDQLKFRYPQLFPEAAPEPKPEPAPRQVVDGGGIGGSSGGDAFSKLPKEARDAFRRYVENGTVEDTKEARAQWAEDYHNG